ncbi:F0F1 ATP synthase subunit A [Frankia sp. AgB32]|uniref:F0F1 ATP synthase subunit A n=1 Tax=Frankia sp. AgB32 TaxID=631119 RepID=UPI00200D5704|nr:F0F1 ATP synthase subunit A [Frankia sp. AgB32]MCK9896113.1 F0F1 ATP synthase subunit A [Frankia sp. AgB32]
MEVLAVPVLADEGFQGPTKEVFQTPHWFDIGIGSANFYLNKATALTIFAAAFVGVIFWLGFRRAKIIPRGIQNLCESAYDFVDLQIARGVIGEQGAKYTPYLLVLFSFVLVSNSLAVIPGAQFPATARVAVPMVLSIITYVMFNYAGIKANGARAYFKEMVDPAPTAPFGIRLILAPIEVLSTLIVRPFTLAIRLFANMFAGHLLLLVFSLGADYLLPKPPYVIGVLSLLVAIVLTAFELVIDALQAYIITILTAAYIGGAMSHGEHEVAPSEDLAEHAPVGVPVAAHA